MEPFVYKNQKKLRRGYTTGSCAAAAAKAAAQMLLSGGEVPFVDLTTPEGTVLRLEVLDILRAPEAVSCAVRKDAGDDPDVTDGILVYARVEKSPEPGVRIEGGTGVGRVTKPGLEQPVGEAAINRVPRRMIRENVETVCERYGYAGGLLVTVFIPEGEAVAARTFNPRLGIVGGLSVLGTSGIVEPMSEQALISTIRLEIRQRTANGEKVLLIVPGNYGMDFLRQYGKTKKNEQARLREAAGIQERPPDAPDGLDPERAVKCGNFVGEALDAAVECGAEGVLLVGHIGKFVKLAGGIMNTHSRNADARMELLTVQAALLGADVPLLERVMACVTTDEALRELKEAGLLEPVIERLMRRIEFYVGKRVQDRLTVGVITFSNVYGVLGQTAQAAKLAARLRGGS